MNSSGGVYYRNGTFNFARDYLNRQRFGYNDRYFGFSSREGNDWSEIPGLKFSQIDVGLHSVWGVSPSGEVYYRSGITERNHVGVEWKLVAGLTAIQVSVSDMNADVWALSSQGGVYRRSGVSDELPSGSSWDLVTGAYLTYIDVGAAGVWGTSAAGDVYYRRGSRLDSEGSAWALVWPWKLQQVASGADAVWGLSSSGRVQFLLKITETSPTGNDWMEVPGVLQQISVSSVDNSVWGVDMSGNVVHRRQ